VRRGFVGLRHDLDLDLNLDLDLDRLWLDHDDELELRFGRRRRGLGTHVRGRRTLSFAGVIDVGQFQAVDMRVGRVVSVEDFPEARVPAWKLTIDFGPEIGIKRSSAQITHYPREQLEGSLIVGVVNLTPRVIARFKSEVLVLGALDDAEGVVLLRPDKAAAVGSRIA
jgi:tRNA-binding protein